jgi:hypothetical protein
MKNNQTIKGGRGGARAGAGRRPNTPNRVTQELQAKVASEGITPLDYLLSVMRDAKADDGKRIDCAKAAAQYVHPKLASVEAKQTIDGELVFSWQP